MYFYGYEAIKVSYYFAMVGGHRHSGGRDTMSLVCHVIWQDHLIKGSCGFFCGILS